MTRFLTLLLLLLLVSDLFCNGQTVQNPLKDSLEKYYKWEDYDRSVVFAREWVNQLKNFKDTTGVQYGFALNSLGNSLRKSGQIKEAEIFLLKGLKIYIKEYGKDHKEVAMSYHNLGVLYANGGQNKKAELNCLKAIEIRIKLLGKFNPDVAESMDLLAWNYTCSAQYKKAEPIYFKSLEILKMAFGEIHEKVADAYEAIGLLNYSQGKYEICEPYIQKSLAIRKALYGENHKSVSQTYSNLGSIYDLMDCAKESLEYMLKALSIHEVLGSQNENLLETYSSLSVLYDKLGQKANRDFYDKKIFEFNKYKTNSCETLCITAENFHNSGRLLQADNYYKQALEVKRKEVGNQHPEIASLYCNLGEISSELGQYILAQTYLKNALKIRIVTLGETHPLVAVSNELLAENYILLNKYPEAETCYSSALKLWQLSGVNTKHTRRINFELAKLYTISGIFSKAEDYLKIALAVEVEIKSGSQSEFAEIYQLLGILYSQMGLFQKSEDSYLKALSIWESGHDLFNLMYIYSHLAVLAHAKHDIAKASSFYGKANTTRLQLIQTYFSALSDQMKTLAFNEIQPAISQYVSFCLGHGMKYPELRDEQYNAQLKTKAVLLNTSARWKNRVKNSGDVKLLNLYTEWSGIQDKITILYSGMDSIKQHNLDSLLSQNEKLETELNIRAERFGKSADKNLHTWKDVQAKLKPGEAAIEMIRFQKFGIQKTVTDTSDPNKTVYKAKGLTDTIQYAALIVKPGLLHPEMVLLPNGNELEGKGIKAYKNQINLKTTDEQSYNRYWKKINQKLKGINQVYFSADGVYHQINLNTLYNPASGKYLLDEKDIRLVTVTKDLLLPKKEEPDNKLANLFGHPDYYINSLKVNTNVTRQRSSPELIYSLDMTDAQPITDLPGTKTEVSRISDLLSANGFEVQSFTEEKALEDNLKESYKPRLLHIATHGFFTSDSAKDPLLRSGLMLAGAGTMLKGKQSESTEDGILTAYEAMNLNLDNTDLVVLSACETGLGEIKNGEGVYGLQRAFKVAGAKSIIMSLWKVSDQATQELMVGFYKHWLGSNAVGAARQTALEKRNGLTKGADRNTKRSAFLKAQKELKAKYPSPYYWGAFVMVGE